MENCKLFANKHTPIPYLLRKQEAPTVAANLPDIIIRLEVRALQVTLEGSAYDSDNKDLYSELFQLTYVSIEGTYVKKFSRTKDGRKAYFAIRQHFIGDNEINRAKN